MCQSIQVVVNTWLNCSFFYINVDNDQTNGNAIQSVHGIVAIESEIFLSHIPAFSFSLRTLSLDRIRLGPYKEIYWKWLG